MLGLHLQPGPVLGRLDRRLKLANFPQAFTHLPLIMAAPTLDEALDRERDRR